MSLSKRIASATVQLALSSGLVRLLSLVTMPVLSHLLAPSAFGKAALAGSMISLVSVFALAGMDMSYVRAYVSNSSVSKQAVEIFAWRFVFGAGILTSVGVMAAWQLIAGTFGMSPYLGGLLGVGIVFLLTSTMAQARARLNYSYREISISMVVSGIGSAAISVGAAYWWRQDELPLILYIVAINMIPVLILGLPPIRRICKSSGLNKRDRLDILRVGLPGLVTAPAYWMLSLSDRWFLGIFEDATSVGIYSIGYGIASMGLMANQAVLTVWTPETAREFEINPDQARVHLGGIAERLVAGFASVWLAITAAGGDMIRLLTAPAFHSAAALVPFIAAGVFFYGISHLANASLLYKKRLDCAMWWWIAGGVFCMLLNLALVPWLGRLGAALAQTFSFAFVATGIVAGAQKLCPLELNLRRLGGVLAGVFLMGITMFPAWSEGSVLSMFLKLPVGILVVAAIIRLIAPEVLLWANQHLAIMIRKR